MLPKKVMGHYLPMREWSLNLGIKFMNHLLMNIDVKPRCSIDLNASRRIGVILSMFS
jgi:hypothetical protein